MTRESHSPSALQHSTSLSDSSENGLLLSELSPRDKPWDKHRAVAEVVEMLYASSDFSKLGERISGCSTPFPPEEYR